MDVMALGERFISRAPTTIRLLVSSLKFLPPSFVQPSRRCVRDVAGDALLDDILGELNAIIGTHMPRQVLNQRDIIVGERDAAGDEICSTGNLLEWYGVRCGGIEVYCIVIARTSVDKSTWQSQAITGYVGGVSIGTVGTVAADKAYLYYSRPYNPSAPDQRFHLDAGGADKSRDRA